MPAALTRATSAAVTASAAATPGLLPPTAAALTDGGGRRQVFEFFQAESGLLVVSNYRRGRQFMLRDGGLRANSEFFARVFEVGRREWAERAAHRVSAPRKKKVIERCM